MVSAQLSRYVSPLSAHSHRRCSPWLLLLEAVAQIWTGCAHGLQLSRHPGISLNHHPVTSPVMISLLSQILDFFFFSLLSYALILVEHLLQLLHEEGFLGRNL